MLTISILGLLFLVCP